MRERHLRARAYYNTACIRDVCPVVSGMVIEIQVAQASQMTISTLEPKVMVTISTLEPIGKLFLSSSQLQVICIA